MRELPILFQDDMVKAILDGRKWQTRRLRGLNKINENPDLWKFSAMITIDGVPHARFWRESDTPNSPITLDVRSPYGGKGDHLYVREAWQHCPDCGQINWRACANDNGRSCQHCDGFLGRWKPSIHMFRRDSRITLENKSVRIERVQDITAEDAVAEGVETVEWVWDEMGDALGFGPRKFIKAFFNLWDSINDNPPKRPYGCNVNSWVWVVEFKEA